MEKKDITLNDEEKKALIHKAIQTASQIMIMAYMACGLKRGIETTVIEDTEKKAFEFSFKETDFTEASKKEKIHLDPAIDSTLKPV